MMVVPEKQMKEHREDSEMNNTLLNHLIRNRIMNLTGQLTKFDRIDDEFVRVLENHTNQVNLVFDVDMNLREKFQD